MVLDLFTPVTKAVYEYCDRKPNPEQSGQMIPSPPSNIPENN